MKYWVGIDIYFESISLPYMPLFLPLKARRTQRFKGFLGALCGVGGLYVRRKRYVRFYGER